MEKILIINGGSSSLKFELLNKNTKESLANGAAKRIFVDGLFIIKVFGKKYELNVPLNSHSDAIEILLQQLKEHKLITDLNEIKGIGHRIVQGGEVFLKSCLIDKQVLKQIRELGDMAPLHNPGEANIIEAFMKKVPNTINVAVFDTSFHATMPKLAYTYAVPEEWYTKYKVRRYGAHGTSHKYIARRMEKELNKKPNIISCHLGNGASICAIKNGESINVSMGLTPLAGLIMGTRSGDLDPSITEYIVKKTGMTIQEVTHKLNNESGLKALSGISSDFRDIRKEAEAGNEKAKFTIDIFAARVATYVVNYANQINDKIDGIVFTAGIGENSPEIREAIIKAIPLLNLEISNTNNKKSYDDLLKISSNNSKIDLYAIRTDEESIIIEDLLSFM
ncbi:MAG: acetate kinase [Mycoplasma sp.]|nr:acetate kinase [Mycoplasma sp.]